jgi:hypothetical protein
VNKDAPDGQEKSKKFILEAHTVGADGLGTSCVADDLFGGITA